MSRGLLFLVVLFVVSVCADNERVEHGAASRLFRHDDAVNKHADLEALLGNFVSFPIIFFRFKKERRLF